MHRVTNMIDRASARAPSRVRVLAGTEVGREVQLPAAGVIVGADPSADVVVNDAAVSRKHVRIVPTAQGFDVTDLGSRNGTWLDGAQITRATVPIGATIRLGHTVVQLLPEEDAAALSPSERTSFGALRGTSLPMRQVYSVLERASPSDAPVLVLGESGCGKELAARAIHEHSRRKSGPIVVFDCGAATESLIESELFGHKKGAFTGAQADRPGAFATAHQGTLFLDEIGDLPLALQPKLLRMIERGEITPVGSNKSERFDVRIVAATHRDLWDEVGRGTFRGDLYYRLAVVEVHLPPLRRRPEDVPELVRVFLEQNGASAETIRGIDGPSLERLVRYSWPGNVRELRNVIARAAALSPPGAKFAEMPILLRPDGRADAEGGSPLGRADVPYHEAKDALLSRFDREYCTDLLRRAEGNIAEAARIAGLERKYLYKILERAGVLPVR